MSLGESLTTDLTVPTEDLAGLSIDVEAVGALGLAYAYSDFPVIRQLTVTNSSGRAFTDLTVRIEVLALGQPVAQVWESQFPDLGSQGLTLENIALDLDPVAMANLEELRPGELRVTLLAEGGRRAFSQPLTVLAHNQWHLDTESPYGSVTATLLASFVQPNHPVVREVLARARELLQTSTGSAATQGYQGEGARAPHIMAAVYSALAERGIAYSDPPASWGIRGQKVRLAGEVLGEQGRRGVGTCLDTALTLAACLEATGLAPLIVLIPGHAFVACWTVEDKRPQLGSYIDDKDLFLTLLDSTYIVPIETTALTNEKGVDFASAVSEARLRLAAEGFNCAIDVEFARKRGITPLPAVAVRADGVVEVVEYQPFVAPGFREAAEASEARARGAKITDTSPPRVRKWKRALLDLSMRNPLLNLPSRDTVARAFIPPGALGKLEDHLHSGGSLVLQPSDFLPDEFRARGMRDIQQLASDVLAKFLYEDLWLFLNYTTATHVTRVRSLVRKARTALEETGSTTLYMGLGLLHWQLDGKGLQAPLILVPVRITGGTGRNKTFQLSLDDSGTSTPNFCLLEKLKEQFDLDIPGLREPEADAAGIDIDKALQDVREAILKADHPFRVDETAVIANLHFSTFRIWKDVDDHWSAFLASPLVRHLVDTPTQDFATPASLQQPDLHLPLPSDSSQFEAVEAALRGETFVLEGPPGTGKSQTITNLIAGAVANGKRVLFVAEKQAALEVVKRRLDAVGVGSFCLDLHGRTRKRADVAAAIKGALEAQPEIDQVEIDAVSTELRSTESALERYARALHEPNSVGYSVWSARQRLLAAGNGPCADLDLTSSSLDAEALHAVRTALQRLPDSARLANLGAGTPWELATTGELPDPQGLAADLQHMQQIVTSLSAAHPVIGPVLASATSADDFRSLTSVLEQALPAASVLRQVSSPGWQTLYDGLIAEMQTMRANPPAILGLYRPQAVRLPLESIKQAAVAAKGSGFLKRKGNIRAVFEQLAPALLPGAVPEDDKVVEIVDALIALRAGQGYAISRTATVPGLDVGPEWNVFEPSALDQLETRRSQLLAATRIFERATTAGDALMAATGQHHAVDAVTLSTLRLAADAWEAVLTRLGATPESTRLWLRARSLGDAWSTDLTAWLADAAAGFRSLSRWAQLQADLAPLRDAGLDQFLAQLVRVEIAPDDALLAFERGLAQASFDERWAAGDLQVFDGETHDLRIERFGRADSSWRSIQERLIPHTAVHARPFRPGTVTGHVGDLLREVSKTRGGKSLRLLLETYHETIATLMPCFMMSPESVAQFLRPGLFTFDLVVFDEASQVRVAEAIGALGRARTAVVVGDSKQMPPTTFGASRLLEPEELDELTDDAPEDQESILSECVEARVPRRWLTWHYRSQDESLIAFSNTNYYEGKLASFPTPSVASQRKGLSFVRVQGQFLRNAKGDQLRTNPEEARVIVEEVRRRLADPVEREHSIGVITFNAQQQALIENLLHDSQDETVRTAMDRNDDSRLFVKNLENVQGDERDVILFSLAFSPNEQGVQPLNFGPLNNVGGERRLNVAITRARRQVVLFASFDPEDIDPQRTDAVALHHLRSYLKVARDGVEASSNLLARRPSPKDRHRAEIAAALEAAGLGVQVDVGLSDFRIDLVVAPVLATSEPSLVVLLDGPLWGSGRRVQDRDTLPIEVLSGLMGWPDAMRIWLPDWLSDPDACVRNVARRAEQAHARLGTAPTLAATAATPSPAEADGASSCTVAAVDQSVHESALPPAPAASMLPEQQQPPAPRETDDPRLAAPASDEGDEDEDFPDDWDDAPRFPWFEPASESRVASREILDQLPEPAAASMVLREVDDILSVEGPVELTRLVRIIGRRFDLGAVRAARADAISRVIPVHRFRKGADGVFVWPDTLDPLTWDAGRQSSLTDRGLHEVTDHEIANVVRLILHETDGPVASEELLRTTAAFFGISRLGSLVRERLEPHVTAALRS